MEDAPFEGGDLGGLISKVFAPALAVLVCTYLLYNLFISSRNTVQEKRLPPGPKGLPILGSILSLSALPHQTFIKLAARYGPIVFMYVGSVPTVVISSPEIAKEMFKVNDQVWASRPKMISFDHFSYGGKDIAMAPLGPDWRQARKIGTLELLSPSRVAGFKGTRQREYLLVLKGILEASQIQEGVAVNFKSMLPSMFTNITTQMLWRKRHFVPKSLESAEAIAFQELIRETFAMLASVNMCDYIPLLKPLQSLDFQGYTKRIKAVQRKFDHFVEAVIYERRTAKSKYPGSKSGDKTDSSDLEEDFVDVLLRLSKEAENSSDEDVPIEMVKAILFDMIMAGTDTSSTSTEWIFAELVRHPGVMGKLQSELDTVVGTNRLVDEADIPKLVYLQAVVKEAFRLHPPNPLLVPHESIRDSVLSGYFVPAGTTALVNVYGIQRDSSVWERPLEFYPERFLSSDIDVWGQNFKLFPFGSGRRICPGIGLAAISVQSTVASLAHAFNWSLPGGQKPEDLDMSEVLAITCPKRFPLTLMATPRLPTHLICPEL